MSANEYDYYANDPYVPVASMVYLPEEDPIETIVRRQENRNKAISLGISIGIIGLLMMLLAWWTITIFKSEQIDIVVAASQGEKNTVIDKNLKFFSKNLFGVKMDQVVTVNVELKLIGSAKGILYFKNKK